MHKVDDKICINCGKLFHPARKDRMFCSRECANAYRLKQGKYTISEETRAKMSQSHIGKSRLNNIKLDNIDTLFGLTNEYIINLCLHSPFPGTLKWPADNPIWECYRAKYISPKAAWQNKNYIIKAVNNLFNIVKNAIAANKDMLFVNRIKSVFEYTIKTKKTDRLLREILMRFTIAKIAPKVTAFMPTDFERILEESKIDISKGIYCPMAGFGGIIEGAKQYYKKHNIIADIEAFDINEDFCKYYGWIQKDVLSDYVKTDKVVFVCPPFGPNTERWKGTPDSMYYEFKDWVKLIKEHIEAPNYIFIGPEIGSQRIENPKNNIKTGLFGKKRGIQWYPEYSK